MTEQLPISIFVCDDLSEKWPKFTPTINKLAAQFNFQAMTANWYGDEDTIPYVQLFLETPQRFAEQKSQEQISELQSFKIHSDDVFSFNDNKESQQLIYTIAITEVEQELLEKQAKLLRNLLQIKLQKIFEIIAKQLNLNPI